MLPLGNQIQIIHYCVLFHYTILGLCATFVWIGNAKNMQVSQDYVCCFNSGVQLLNKHIEAPPKACGTAVYKGFKCDIVSKRFIRLGSIFMLFPSLTPVMNGLQIYCKYPIILCNIVHM